MSVVLCVFVFAAARHSSFNWFGSCSKVYTPKVKLWGRGGGVRLSARNMDVLILSLYFPPRANQGAAAGVKYRSTVTDLITWTEQVISDAPHRTLPILGLDLNDGLGRQRGQPIRSDALSIGCQSKEGFASKHFREMFERQHMYIASGTPQNLPRTAGGRHDH